MLNATKIVQTCKVSECHFHQSKRLQLHDCISVKEKQSNCKRTALIIYLAIGIVKPDGRKKNDI